MSKLRRRWPENWRRGPRLAARVKTKLWGRRVVVAAALLSFAGAIAIQFLGDKPNEAHLQANAISAPAAAPKQNILAAAPSLSTASASAVSEQEQALWANAMMEKTRASVLAYQGAFPAGAYAAKAKEALASCRQQTRERWSQRALANAAPGRGAAAIPADAATEPQACDMAKGAARSAADQACRSAIAGKGLGAPESYRNPSSAAKDAPCNCQPSADGGTVCTAELEATCNWQEKVSRTVEVCGG